MKALGFFEKNSFSFFSKTNTPFHKVRREFDDLKEKDHPDNDADNPHLGQIDVLCETSVDVVDARFNSFAKGFHAY